jgi:RNA polymerase sigma-70 factor (ECF subfamily)
MQTVLPDGAQSAAEFDDFFLSTRDWAIGAVTLVTRDVTSAEDAVQEAYVKASKKWDRISRLQRPDLWVLRVATNVAIDGWRKRRLESELDPGLSTSTARLVDEAWVRWGLDNLNPKQRAVVVMHHAHGLPIAAIAEKMHVTEISVQSHLARARNRLRWLLSSEVDG